MRETEITIINHRANGSYTTTIEFDTVQDFMTKANEAIDSTDFGKVDVDFDTDVFTADEQATLKKNKFLW